MGPIPEKKNIYIELFRRFCCVLFQGLNLITKKTAKSHQKSQIRLLV